MVVRMFQRKKPTGKALSKVKPSKKEQEEMDEMRAKGVDAVDLKTMQKNPGVVSLESTRREELLEGAASGKNRRRFGLGKKDGGRGEPAVAPVQTRDIEENYSEYPDGVAGALRQQDEDLDKIGDALSDMKALATAMNHELNYQGKLIEEAQDSTAETRRRTKANAQKVSKIK